MFRKFPEDPKEPKAPEWDCRGIGVIYSAGGKVSAVANPRGPEYFRQIMTREVLDAAERDHQERLARERARRQDRR